MTTATDVRTVGVWRATLCVTASRSAETVRMKPLTSAAPSNAREVRMWWRRYISRNAFHSLHIMFIFHIRLQIHNAPERSAALVLLCPGTGIAWFSVHLYADPLTCIVHARTWLSKNVQSLSLNYNVSFCASCLFEIQPPTDNLDDVQTWRNNGDWQLINNAQLIGWENPRSWHQSKNFELMVTQQ